MRAHGRAVRRCARAPRARPADTKIGYVLATQVAQPLRTLQDVEAARAAIFAVRDRTSGTTPGGPIR